MLDRLVGTVNALADVAERNTRDISALKSSVDGWVNLAQIHQQSIEAVVTEMREMHAEIKELQTENRHILDQLLNREDDQG